MDILIAREHLPISVTSHVQTIEENAKFLTPKEIAQANVAKQFYIHWVILQLLTSRPSLKQMQFRTTLLLSPI